jgi:hypothetical protein
MPFGLCNAASTFERIIEKTLAGLQWQIAVLYLDDIVVFGKSFEDHLCNLRKVFAISRSKDVNQSAPSRVSRFLSIRVSG